MLFPLYRPRALPVLSCLTVAASALVPVVARAQAGDAQRIVVSAARSEQALPEALPSTRIITRAEIDDSQAADLPGLLRALTSIDVAQTGPLGSQASLFLRGADSRQTLVLIDGVPLSRADFGTASWQHLSPDQIERIEIVRGNLSSLYGAQAVGGVVQVITRRALAPEATLSFGSHGVQRAAAAGGAQWNGDATRLSASLSWHRTDGYSARDASVDPAANPDRDAARQVAGSARLEQSWAVGHRTQLHLVATRSRSEYDGFTPGLADVLHTRVESAGVESRHAIGTGLELGVDLGQTSERFEDPTGFATNGRNRVRQGGAQIAWKASADHEWQVGLEARRERFADSGTPSRERRTDSARVAWLARPADRWHVQFALRSDDSNDFGRATTGLAALAYDWAPGWKLSAQWASGFSAPSFLDQLFAHPTTMLKAERSRQAELALQWNGGATQLRTALFAQRQRDRIAFDPVTFESTNIARAKNRGIELLAQTALASGTLGGEVTLQDPRDADTDTPLKRRARQSIALRYQATWAGWHGGAALRHTGKRLDTDPLTFADAYNPSRTTIDLTLARQVTPVWRVAAKIDNATGSRRPEVLGYTAPPRAWLLSLQATPR
ncbi:MAG: TonB-dependent receptor [Aquincola sp.]|nr:TonB-dependent receptor [Aquincola sp.]